jgi:hypothetical protein
MTKVRTGPDCASIGLAQDAFVGVKHSSTFSRLAQRRIASQIVLSPVSRRRTRSPYRPGT